MIDMKLVNAFIGDVPIEQFKYIDTYWGENILVATPNGGIFEYVTQLHNHPTYFFVIFTHHSNYIKVKDKLIKIKPREVWVLSPGVDHYEVPIEPQSRYFVISIKADIIKKTASMQNIDLDHYEGSFFKDSENLLTYMYEYINEIKAADNTDTYIMKHLEELLINKAVRILSTKELYDKPHVISDNIEKAIIYIFDHLNTSITLDTLSKLTCMSKSHFQKLFKESLNVTPMKYISDVRLEKSKDFLINGEKSIKEISVLCGFKSSAYFSSVFKKRFGISPKEYSSKYK